MIQLSDEQRQAEIKAFSEYFSLINKRGGFTAQTRNLINLLRQICIGNYGNGLYQDLRRKNIPANETSEEQAAVVKSRGDVSRRQRQPEKQPNPQSARAARIAERLGVQQQVTQDRHIPDKSGKKVAVVDEIPASAEALTSEETGVLLEMKPAAIGKHFGIDRLRATADELGIEYTAEHSATSLGGAILNHLKKSGK